jgi:hypothetical protein
MSLARSTACLFVLIGVMTCANLEAGEAPVKAPVKSAATTPASKGDGRSLRDSEAKQYLAQLTEERNSLRQDNDTLRSRQGLLLIYGVVLTLLSGWLMFRALSRKPATGKPDEVGTDPFTNTGGTSAVMRKNATITIRNSNTQQAEVVGKVQTRRAYARTETASHTRPATRALERRDAVATPTPPPVPTRRVVAPELDPATPVMHTPTTRRHAPATAPLPAKAPAKAPATVRIEQQSDRLEPVEVAVKPGTGTARRGAGASANP